MARRKLAPSGTLPRIVHAECMGCTGQSKCLVSRFWAELVTISKRGLNVRTLAPRQVLAAEGQAARDVWVIKEGLLLSSRLDQQGNEVPTGIHTTGNAIGLLESFTSGRQFKMTVTSLTPSTLCCIDGEDLRLLSQNHAGVVEAVADVLENEREFLSTYGVALLGQSVKVRLLRLLLELRHPFGVVRDDGVLHLHIPVPRNVLAGLIGTTPETLSRTIRELQESSVIVFEGAEVLIPDLDSILDIVEKTATP